jgi:hypothetical protein
LTGGWAEFAALLAIESLSEKFCSVDRFTQVYAVLVGQANVVKSRLFLMLAEASMRSQQMLGQNSNLLHAENVKDSV